MRLEFGKIGSQKLENNFCTNYIKNQDIDRSKHCQCLDNTNLYPANYNNLTFTAKSDAKILLENANNLVCAYSGKKMLSPYEVRGIYSKLRKRQNAASMVLFLQNYESYMHKTELEVFNLLKGAKDKENKDFKEILSEHVIEAHRNLKGKQVAIMESTNDLVNMLSDDTRDEVIAIKDNAIERINDFGFSRKYTLRELRNLSAKGNDKKIINEIFKAWHKLPNSKTDSDAFIKKYFFADHFTIAKSLLSSSVATIEHIKPSSKGGANKLENYMLVSSKYNALRDSLPLNMFNEIYPELKIENNLQRYMNVLIHAINTKNIDFIRYDNYPELLKESISRVTNGKIELDISKVNNHNNNSKSPKQKTVKKHKSFNRFK